MARTVIRADGIQEDTLEDADSDTKVQVEESSDEDKIRFDTGGTERMIIGASGNVGIGTSSPEVALHISSTADATLADNSSGVLMIGVNTGNNITIDNNEIMARNNTSADILHLQAEGGTVRIHHSQGDSYKVNVNNSGDVSLGGTSPIAKLDVAGKIAITSEASTPSQPADGKGFLYTKTDGKLYWRSYDISETDLTAGGSSGDITAVTAGVGLSGGATSGDATLTVDFSEFSTVTPANGDFLATLDSDGSTEQKTAISALATLMAGTASSTGLSASSSVLSVSDLHPVGVDGSANQLLTDDGDGTMTSESKALIDGAKITIGNGTAEDTLLVFDGNAADFRIGIDDDSDTLEIGAGAAHDTTAAIVIDGSGHVTKIGQDTHTSGQFLKWDGSKAVWDAASASSLAADDLTTGDADVDIATSSGKITLDSSTGVWHFDEDGTTVLKINTEPDANDIKFTAPVDNGQIYFVKEVPTDTPVYIISLLTDGSATGYVGINQTSAANLLDIKCSANSDQGLQIKNSNADVSSLLSGEGLYYSRLQMKDTQTGNTRLQLSTRPGVHDYMMDNNLGIGTTTPGTLLQLEGSAPYITLKNDTSENSDGGCESRIIFEDHANVSLARIQGSHDGSSDDTKGDLIFSTHDGSSLTEALRIDSSQKATFASGFAVGSDAAGDILYHNGTSYIRLPKGTADQVLTMNDGATAPGWETASGGGGSSKIYIETFQQLKTQGSGVNISSYTTNIQNELLTIGGYGFNQFKDYIMTSADGSTWTNWDNTSGTDLTQHYFRNQVDGDTGYNSGLYGDDGYFQAKVIAQAHIIPVSGTITKIWLKGQQLDGKEIRMRAWMSTTGIANSANEGSGMVIGAEDEDSYFTFVELNDGDGNFWNGIQIGGDTTKDYFQEYETLSGYDVTAGQLLLVTFDGLGVSANRVTWYGIHYMFEITSS